MRSVELEEMLEGRFGIDHTTLQVDHESDELVQIGGAGQRRPSRSGDSHPHH